MKEKIVMKKYIPAEKLLSEIKKILDENKYDTTYDCAFRDGNNCAVQRIKNIAIFLQREPKSSSNLVDIDTVREDFIAEVYRVLDADSTNDRANAIIDAFDSLPTVSQVQPEEAYIFKPNMTIDEMKDSINGKQREVSIKCGVRVYPELDGKPRPWVSLYGKGINIVSFRDLPELESLGFKDDDTAIITIAKKEDCQ